MSGIRGAGCCPVWPSSSFWTSPPYFYSFTHCVSHPPKTVSLHDTSTLPGWWWEGTSPRLSQPGARQWELGAGAHAWIHRAYLIPFCLRIMVLYSFFLCLCICFVNPHSFLRNDFQFRAVFSEFLWQWGWVLSMNSSFGRLYYYASKGWTAATTNFSVCIC